MPSILDSITCPADIKKLNKNELKQLADEIRRFMIENVSETGGHLASNLGVVELTIALMRAFDFPNDKIVWDVGHQSYIYKILTGRKDRFKTLRRLNGLSGFPKTDESEYDFFNTGHSSTSISAASGLAKARDLKGESHNVVAFIGDGALTGGMAYEALNHAGQTGSRLIVILNDNQKSISDNVGSMAKYLNSMRSKKKYVLTKSKTEKLLKAIPLAGNGLYKGIRHIKSIVRHAVSPGMLFENLGFTYIGPINGTDFEQMQEAFEYAIQKKNPILVHVSTKKGKGYRFAEQNPDEFHGVGSFDIKTGCSKVKNNCKSMSLTFGKHLSKLAKTNSKIIGISAAMPLGTGMLEFAYRYPNRFVDVGIAEQHAVTYAAGMACDGFVPVVGIYSTFLQRAYDQVFHDVCLQQLHVVFCLDRGGISGRDGETHHGIFDISYMSHLPSMSVLAPSSPDQLIQMMDYAVNIHTKPISIRYPKELPDIKTPDFEFGKSAVITEGSDVTLVSVGDMLSTALEAANRSGKSVEVIDLRCVAPLDTETIQQSADKTKRLIVIENHSLCGGAGSIIKNAVKADRVVLKGFAKDDIPKQGSNSELFALYGLDADTLIKDITEICNG